MNKIKMFSDYACPYCYIGFSIADRLQKEEPNIEFEFLPYELNPEGSNEPGDVRDFMPEDVLMENYKGIKSLGDEYDLVFENKTKAFNTHRILLAGVYAEKEDKLFEFSKEAFKAIFEDGKDVAKTIVVNEIGLKAGLDIDAMNKCIDNGSLEDTMERAKHLARAYKVDSVPTFIINDNKKVTDLKPYSEFKKKLIG